MSLFIPLVLAATLSANVDKVLARYDSAEAKHLVPMTSEVVKFPTYEKNDEAHAQQKAWLMAKAKELGLVARDAGKVTEIELPGPKNAPVLGLLVHGDVQTVDADAWSFPPFSGDVVDGFIQGRGSADDKGPLVSALLAMKSLKESGVKRTHTIRLLVGSEEESSAEEMGEYLKTHKAPDYSLVLDSEFPVIVGEKAWNALYVSSSLAQRGAPSTPYSVKVLTAGLAPSIVPDRAEMSLVWRNGEAKWQPLIDQLQAVKMPEGTRLVTQADGDTLRVIAYGKSSHAGVNLTGGRNALVGLATALEDKLPKGGADDLLAIARLAGQDLYGTGLGITDDDPLWGRYAVNVATIKTDADDPHQQRLTINLRSIPPRTGAQLQAHLDAFIADYNRRTGAVLQTGGWYNDEVLGWRPDSPLVKRLLAAYTRATGEPSPKPRISGGGTYAKRLPNAIAFGMWFPDKPYPGHDVDEKLPVADLEKGTRVLIHALVDIATGRRIEGALVK